MLSYIPNEPIVLVKRVVALAAALIATASLAAAATLPPAAQGVTIPEKGYLVEEVNDGLYWVTEGDYQAMFLTTGEGVILVDAPLFMGEMLGKAIAEVTDEPVTHLIYSHSHADHIAGAALFESVEVIIAHAETKARLERAGDPRRPVPTEVFTDQMTLTVGSQTLELSYTGPNHSIGNIYIYAPKQKVLMAVDMISPGWAAWKNLENTVDVPGFYEALDQLQKFDFEVFLGGHLNRLGTREDVDTARTYYHSLRDAALAAIENVDFGQVAQTVVEPNAYSVFGAYIDAVAQQCAEQVIDQWQDTLGGVGVFTKSSCSVMATSLMSD